MASAAAKSRTGSNLKPQKQRIKNKKGSIAVSTGLEGRFYGRQGCLPLPGLGNKISPLFVCLPA